MAGMTVYRAFGWCSAILLMAGCATGGSYQLLKEAAPEAGDFSQSLAAEYLGYAESQFELGQAADAERFAAKGLRALDGEAVEPDPASQPIVEEARSRLLILLTNKVKEVMPEESARAQLLFDCWNHQQEQMEEGQEAPCALEFNAVVKELEDAGEAFDYPYRKKTLFQFSETGATLTDEMNGELDAVAAQAVRLRNYQIELQAMPEGTGEYYDDMAAAHMLAVREGLIARGIPPERIDSEDETSGKTVYLSHDRKAQPQNSVMLQIKAMHSINKGAQ